MKLSDAFAFAQSHHSGEVKKGTSLPFLYQPMAVAALVLKYGGDDDQAAAALLCETKRSDIEKQFGSEVAALAAAAVGPTFPADDAADISVDWRVAMDAYLKRIGELDERALLIVLCRELNGIDELLHDLRYVGHSVWDRHQVHGMELGWFYREVARIALKRLDGSRYQPLISEFSNRVRALKAIVFDAKPY